MVKTMNERIKELAEQAGIDFFGDHGLEATQANLQEFAELIVRECAAICDRVEDEYLDNDQLLDNEKYAIGAGICRNTLHKHFGVE